MNGHAAAHHDCGGRTHVANHKDVFDTCHHATMRLTRNVLDTIQTATQLGVGVEFCDLHKAFRMEWLVVSHIFLGGGLALLGANTRPDLPRMFST